MAKTEKNPGAALQTFIDKCQINHFSLSKNINMNYKVIYEPDKSCLFTEGKNTLLNI
jgi:hypothetical protein